MNAKWRKDKGAKHERYRQLLTKYAEGPHQLEGALTGLSGTDLNTATSPENWTIRQIIHHLIDGDDFWNGCIKAALGNPDGIFNLHGYWILEQDRWVEKWHYVRRPIPFRPICQDSF